MPCYRPLKAYRAPGGQIKLNSREGWSDRPLELRCGKCDGCRQKQAQSWAIRMVHESQVHKRNAFVTLTYDQVNLPEDGSLDIEHWQNFAKRLRHSGRFRFYMCGEYGEVNHRPHYHCILFGRDFSDDRYVWRKNKRGERLYRSPLLEDTWGMGNCEFGDVTYESCAYVAKYVMKKKYGNDAAEEYGDLKPPFNTMSRNPGIGAKWLEQFADDVYSFDECVVEGRRYRPPRFYDERIEEEFLKRLKAKRLRAAATQSDDLTPERLRARERVAARRLSRARREI